MGGVKVYSTDLQVKAGQNTNGGQELKAGQYTKDGGNGSTSDLTFKTTGDFNKDGNTDGGYWRFHKNQTITITSNVGTIDHVYISFSAKTASGDTHGSNHMENATGSGTWTAIKHVTGKLIKITTYGNGCWCSDANSGGVKSVTLRCNDSEAADIIWIWVEYSNNSSIANLTGGDYPFGNDNGNYDDYTVQFGANCKYIVGTDANADPLSGGSTGSSATINKTCYVSARKTMSVTVGSYGTDACPHRGNTLATYTTIYRRKFIKHYTLTVSGNGYTTFCHTNCWTVPSSGCTAYAYNIGDGSKYGFKNKKALYASGTYGKGSVIPKGAAVIVKATADCDFTNPMGDDDSDAQPYTNVLTGNPKSTDQTYSAGNNYYYYLMKGGGSKPLGFYWGAANGAPVNSGNAHKAWLVLAKGTAAKGFVFCTPDDLDTPTAIEGIRTDDAADGNAPMYSISGQRVGASYKGIVIQNGRKFIKR